MALNATQDCGAVHPAPKTDIVRESPQMEAKKSGRENRSRLMDSTAKA